MSQKRVGNYIYLVMPMIVIMGMIIGWPLIQTFIFSFTDATLLDIEPASFVGIKNFIDAFKNSGFQSSMKISAQFAAFVVASEVILGTSVALLLNQPLKGVKTIRVFLILPWAVPTVVNGLIWRLIYNPEYGALNSILYQMGWINNYMSWLGNPNRALWAIIFADVWKNFSLVSMIVLAALQSIPESQLEAAVIDGANSWQKFWSITFPYIIPSLQVATTLRIIEAVKVFDVIFVMTKGGPANKTRSASIFIYQEAFTNSRIGSGAAYAIIMVLFIVLLVLFYLRLLKKD